MFIANISYILVTFEVLKLLISNDVIDLQRKNISVISVTLEVSKLLVDTELSDSQSRNIRYISVTFIVLKFIFNVFKEVHSSNMDHIFCTDDVSKCDKSKVVILQQPLNIADMSMTFDVLKLLKSNCFSEEQPLNIKAISVVSDVSKFSSPLIDVTFLKSSNK